MRRFLHPLAFFAAALLLLGLVLDGAANALVCGSDCPTTVTDLRLRVALALLIPGLALALAAWDIAVTLLVLRRSWRACALLFSLPLAAWITLLAAAPAFGLPWLGLDRANGAVTAISSAR